MHEPIPYRIAELERLLNNLILIGTISEVDHPARKLRVKAGDLHTAWLDWPAEIGRNFVAWRPLRVGTQVILASPGGDTTQAKVVGVLYTNNIDAPSPDPEIDLVQFEDGNLVKHDRSSGQITIIAHGDVVVEQGNIKVPNGDVVASGVSLVNHVHTGITPGPAETGVPKK